MDSPTASARNSLRALGRRWRHLNAEVRPYDAVLDDVGAQASPTLRDAYGIGADLGGGAPHRVGDNPEPIRSEAAFAKPCGTCPIPASLGHQPALPLPRWAPPIQRGALPSRHRANAFPPKHAQPH